ncbi:unnamed protein product [Adineta ricciae]|uniref:Uncharacterized protein n=1 Tax=Adineta ricciae TaxID=249248 RepID=A0A814F4L7_ADIRI|nr:unnamed protein product [Adineta ricciae]
MAFVKYLFYICLFSGMTTLTLTIKRHPLVFVLCLKGFRWDLPYSYSHLPNFRRLSTTGSQALWVDAEFGGSQTNILSLMSGLHVEHHARQDFIETIPVINEHVGGHTRLLHWPWFDRDANDSVYEHLRSGRKSQPEILESYSNHGRMPLQRLTKHLTKIFNSLTDENDRTNLIMSFVDDPFVTLKHHGIHSNSIRRTMLNIDRLIGRILSFTTKNQINLIVLGDHGIASIDCRQAIHLHNIFSKEQLDYYADRYSGTSFSFVIYPKSDYTQQILLSQLRNFPNEQIEIFTNDQNRLPPRLRLPVPSNKPSPIIVFAKEKFYFSYKNEQNADYCPNEYSPNCQRSILADHSDDPRHLSMRTALFAHGPLFRKGHINEPVLITDVYALLRQILCLSPIALPRNGLFSIHQMLDFTSVSNTCAHLYLSSTNMLHTIATKPAQPPEVIEDDSQLVYVNITEGSHRLYRNYVQMQVTID